MNPNDFHILFRNQTEAQARIRIFRGGVTEEQLQQFGSGKQIRM